MNTLLIVILAAFLIEQIFCFFLGSYPYRYGVLIKKIALPVADLASWKYGQERCHGLKLKMSEEKKEVYCRYRYQYGTGGPFIFIGQVKFSTPGTLLIRIGPCAGLLLIAISSFSIFRTIQDGGLYGLLNVFAVVGAVLFFYFQMVKSVRQCEEIIVKP